MREQDSSAYEAEQQARPEFDAGFFTISYFSTDPEGFHVQTRQSLPRRDLLPGKSYPGELALSPDQRTELRKGMANEAFFTLP